MPGTTVLDGKYFVEDQTCAEQWNRIRRADRSPGGTATFGDVRGRGYAGTTSVTYWSSHSRRASISPRPRRVSV